MYVLMITRHCEKAKKLEKNPTCFDFYSIMSKQLGDHFSNFCARHEDVILKLGYQEMFGCTTQVDI